MVEATESNAPYYYHFDALGSVVAVTDGAGDTVEVYDYSVYGQVGASDPNRPNRFMFTGREYDRETGLYYYRARYYNPQIGRFLQTDPVGCKDGMNLYRYCGNSPVVARDPSGLFELIAGQGTTQTDVNNVEAAMKNVATKCKSIISEVEVLLAAIDADGKINKHYGNHDKRLKRELRLLSGKCTKILDAIESKTKRLTIEVVNFADPNKLGEYERPGLLESLTGDAGTIRFDVSVFSNRVDLSMVTMHELGHWSGIKGDHVGGSWTHDAHRFDDLSR